MTKAGSIPAATPATVPVISGPVSAAAPAAAPSVGAPRAQHDVVLQIRLVRDALQSDKVRLGLFLGAGCPLGIYDEKGLKSLRLTPDVATLTKQLKAALEAQDAKSPPSTEKFAPMWNLLSKACLDDGEKTPNVEHILTELRTLSARRGKSAVDGLTKENLSALDAKVCDLIVAAVGNPLPTHRNAYSRLASWVGGLQRAAAVDIFTLNYDLLLEEAFERRRIPHFDGFVGSREPFFDIASIEQDAIPRRWTRLWKIHGSINWQRRDGVVYRVQGHAGSGQAMIYPSHLKYDESRRMPYLAMIDRLRTFFRPGGHVQGFGPPVLVVSGYSFSDGHINEVLLDGLQGNPAAQCFVLAHDGLGESKAVIKLASEQQNLTVLASDGAVVGAREGAYVQAAVSAGDQDQWIAKDVIAAGGGKVGSEIVRCRLGDFHYFALFLEQLYGGKSEDERDAART